MTYQNIVILTGAGISAESGLSTFRDEGGLWAKHRIEDVATPEAFIKNPDLVQGFYNARRRQLQDVTPNGAHLALAKLEKEHSGPVTIITQNVDDLHERALSHNVIHMHGELSKVRCTQCGRVQLWLGDCTQDKACSACGKSPALRPYIVWFGELPYYMDRIHGLLGQCDLFISIGTSGTVYPAAGFVADVQKAGYAHTLEINLEPSAGISYFAEARFGKAGDLVPVLVDELLGK